MNKKDILKRIDELSDEINRLKESVENACETVGFEDDEIFLLSEEEYMRYKNVIPVINSYWWLRSPSHSDDFAEGVDNDGSIYYGDDVYDDDGCVRPALHLESSNHQIGDRIIKYDFPWIVINKCLAIAEVPIGFEKFDDKSNDYETSYIRKWLKEWKKNR